jgi:hypothetical protein
LTPRRRSTRRQTRPTTDRKTCPRRSRPDRPGLRRQCPSCSARRYAGARPLPRVPRWPRGRQPRP